MKDAARCMAWWIVLTLTFFIVIPVGIICIIIDSGARELWDWALR
jgi:hypothetical protein